MGCCVSSNRSPPSSPYGHSTPPAEHTESRAPIATVETHHASSSSITPSAAPAASQSLLSHTQPSRQHQSSSRSQIISHLQSSPSVSSPLQRSSRGLNPPPPSSKISPPPFHSADELTRRPHFTHSDLLRERQAFFETRVTGRPEVWAAIRLVCELVEKGELIEAQAVLEAAGCTCPTGAIWGKRGGVFDELGQKYTVPPWVVGEPEGILNGSEDSDVEIRRGKDEVNSEGDDIGPKKGEKGKGRAVEDEGVNNGAKVRVRLSHTARDLAINISMVQKVHVLIRKVRDIADIPPQTKIKVGYLGKILREHETLEAQGWREGHTLNIYVFE